MGATHLVAFIDRSSCTLAHRSVLVSCLLALASSIIRTSMYTYRRTHQSFCLYTACQRFTPILQEMYRTLKATTEPPEEFEIVLCSGDTMPVPYESYATKMPWWCLPLDAGIVQRLSMEYNVQGYPHLVVLDTDGATVIRPDAVPQVLADPAGRLFPWRTRSLRDVLPAMYQRADRSYAPVSSLDDKYLLLFAAASTCPPCQRLIPHVAEVYRRLKMQRDDFEVRGNAVQCSAVHIVWLYFVKISHFFLLLCI